MKYCEECNIFVSEKRWTRHLRNYHGGSVHLEPNKKNLCCNRCQQYGGCLLTVKDSPRLIHCDVRVPLGGKHGI